MADAIDWSKGTLTPPPGAAPAPEQETDWSKGEMTPPAGLLRRAGDLGLGLAKGVIGVPEALVGVADLPTLGYAGKVAEGLGFRPKEAKAMLDEFKSPEQKAADAKVQQADGFFPTLGAMVQNPSTILGAAAESAPSMLGGGLIGRGVGAVVPRLGGVARGAIGEGAIAAGQNAEQVRQETADGLLTPTQAGVLAASGALTGAISLGAGSVARRLGIGDADTLLAGGTTPAPAQPKSWVRKVAEGFANEGLLEELPQSMQEQAAQNIAQGKPLLEGVGSAGAQGLLVGGLTGAVAGPLSGGEPAAVAPPPAPFSTALLGLPAPRTGPIVVGPNGEAMTSSQALDQRNQEDANLIARGATRGGFADVSGAGLGGYPMTEVAGRPAEVLPAAQAPVAAPALPPAQPTTQPVTAALEAAAPLAQGPQAREAANLLYNEATEADRRIYDQVFGQQDVADVQAREAGVQAPVEDFSNVPWDEPGNASEADFLRAMDPTLTDQEINDLIREADQAREQARPAQATRVDAAAAEAPAAGPARTPAGDSSGQEERGARAVAAPSPTNKPSAAPARRAPAAIDSGANADLGPMVEHTVQKSGKVLRGVIRQGLTPQQAKQIDPGAFRKDGGWFLRERNAEQIRAWDAQQKPAAAPAPSGQAATNSVAPATTQDGNGQQDELDSELRYYEAKAEAKRRAPAPAPAPKPSSGSAAARPPAETPAQQIDRLISRRMDTEPGTPLRRDIDAELKGLGVKDPASRMAAAAPAPAPAPTADATVRVPKAVDDALTEDMAKQQARVKRLRTAAEKDGLTLDEKKAALLKVTAAETTLRKMRQTRFDAEDAAVQAVTDGRMDAFDKHQDLFPGAASALRPLAFGTASGATPAPAAPAPAPAPAPAVKANTIFTEDAAAAARARMKKKLGTLNSGIDPELLQDGITLAGYHIEKGARTFAAYARAMLDDLGEAIRPYLKQLYLATKFDPRAGALASEMDGAAAVEAADLDAIPAEAPAAEQDLASLQQIANSAETPAPPAQAATKSVAKPLYSQQRVAPESAQQIRAWAKAQGFPSVADDLHVTIGYSSAPVDASAVPLAPATTVQNSRARSVERLGDQGAVVLMLGNETSRTQQLAQAHQALRDAGASWDFPSYQPHITISYDAGGLDLSKVQPYGGPINLLAEERSDLDTSPSLPAETPAAAPAPAAAAPAAREVALSDRMYEAINAGRMPENNLQLRKMVEAIDGQAASAARMKQAQEALEAAIARVARDVVKEGRGATNDNGRATFDQLLALYERQPLLNVRTSTSVANQAYSTPAPLAFLASELARIGRGVTVYEPSAGTGMLLMGATPSNVAANELDPARQALLREAGFPVVTPNDATDYVPKGRFDAVITNPPFGSIKNDKGDTIKVPVDGYKLGQIDHLIAARALEVMKDDGRAVLILGANKVAGGVSNDDLIFFNWLYGRYNVAGHFEVSGDLYQRQGAGWPVRVITINGRQASAQVAPAPGTIQRAQGWEQVYAYFNDSLGASEQRPLAGASAGPVGAGTGAPAAGRVQRPAGGEAAGPGGQRPAGSPASAGNVPGAVPGVVADRGGRPGGAVGAGFDEQRINAEPVFPDRLDAARDGGSQPRAAEPARNPGTDGGLASAENQFQATYVPRSGRKDANVLIPVNMQQPLQDALSVLEDAVGDIDQYAARELGYGSTREMHQALMGLQVDSVASAIYQMDQKGKAVIIADQTGIGKGRQAAAIIRWAKNKGHIPVFMSMKPSLFTDMYGDLRDIGTTDVVPFIVNSDGWVSSADGEKLFANRATGHRNTLAAIRDTGELPAGTNAVFLTYSQINTENVQREALSALAPRAVFILDESHNAGGESNTGDFMRNLLEGVRGVTYLSATYAKRPDNMPLYFRTDIGSALSDTDSLMGAMASGGLPLQTVVSNNLVKAGQMFRRERSYDGVEIRSEMDTANRAEHERLSDSTTQALRAIVDADRMFHEVYVKEMDKELRKEGAKAVDNAGNKVSAGVQHTEFSSVVHNFVKQMLLGLKAQGAADRAIAALKRGEKPILAVENTMGSFLAEYAANNALSEGDSLGSFDYRTVLSRALARSRVINVQTPTGDKRKETVSIAKLDPETRLAYERAQAVIDSLDIDIPVSPIDWMRNEIRKAGYSVAEITGRNLTVDYSTRGNPVLSQLDLQEQRDKVRSTRLFNGGQLDALILNVSGSTGISLHASEKFADQRQRHMIVVQPASDINVFMQMLGRIHRTGQVALPRYTLMAADLPTEKRPTALLSKKMKSLNANTSSNTESATSVQSFDMLNKYGDQVVGQYLADNPALLRSLGLEAGIDADGKGIEDIARKATGRLALQSIRTQEAFYAEVEGQYSALINYLNETGQNDLEPRTLDFEARELRQEVLHQGENPDTPFGADSIYGEYSIKAQGKPMKPAEVKAAMAENLEGKTGPEHTAALIQRLEADFNGFAANLSPEQRDEAGLRRSQGRNFIASHGIGQGFRVDINGDTFNAVVTNLRSTHRAGGNPYSLSKVQVTLAIAGPLRSITVPATQFAAIEVSTTPRANVDQMFREASTEGRETAKIITGNLLAAYGELQGVRGTIVSFSKADGTVEQGILLPKTFTLENNTRQDVRMPSGEAAVRFLHESTNENIGRFGINTRDSAVRVLPLGTEGVEIRVPKSKARGAKYFLDRALLEQTGDFVTEGAAMVARVEDRTKAAAALEVIGRKQALYALPSMAEEARAITATSLSAEQPITRQDAEARPDGGYAVNTKAANPERTLKANRLKSALQAATGNSEIQFKAVEPGDVGPVMAQALAAVRSTASRLFGHDVVFVQFDEGSPKLFNGAANRGIPDTVFVRIDSARPHMAIVGHELTHALRTSNPGLYQQLADRLGRLYKSDAGQQYFSRLKAVYDSAGIPLPRDVNEELVSDIVGDNFMDPGFWAAMSTQGQPGPFRMLVQAILRFIDKLANLMTGARPFGTQQYLDDLAAARAAVVEAMAEFSAQRSAKEQGILTAAPASAAQAAINSVAPAMSAEGDAPTLFSLTADPAALQQRAREVTADLFNTPGKLGWWHKTVGTPYNLAQRSPAFKRVFDGVQDFLKDVSAFATEAADLAPRILPKLESLADLKKQPLSAADTQAISRPIFEGTLTWGRDESGRPVQMAALEARYADMSSEQKAGLMLRRGLVAENELKRWKALPIDSYEGAVRNRFEATVLKPGVVWKDDELRSMFGLNDQQVSLYREFRQAIDKSVGNLALSDIVRFAGKDGEAMRGMVMDAASVDDGAILMRDHLLAMAEADPRRGDILRDTANRVMDKADRANDLMKRGYAPLSRFGNYTVDVVGKDGERQYFGMFESRFEAGQMARKMQANFPDATVQQGTVSQESYKLFQGVTPETLELFGDMLGLEAQGDDARHQAFQQYLKAAKSNRSAMKRLIERKGIAGFSEDAGRVLAGFVYSNARQTSSNLHQGNIRESAAEVSKQSGELKDAAIRLTDYVSNPQEEAGGFRGLLFAQYIGGSVASAMVNLTQPLQTTLPYLSQFGGIRSAAKHVRQGVADALKGKTGDVGLDRALKLAEERGIVSPQEVHHLMAQARGAATLQAGNGTRLGDAKAIANNAMSRLQFGWGKLFSTAEQFNRRVTFIAAYRQARENGSSNPMAAAEKAVNETQFVANKGNRPRWARGAVGATLFTFKSYSVNYIELMARMAQSGPEGRKAAALMLGVLMLMGGAGGLPFADDLGDLIDGLMQRLGYSWSTKQKRQEFLQGLFGEAAGNFVEKGVSGISGMPLDVSGRMGMGNLIPGTGLLQKKLDYGRDVTELFGPAGDFAKRAFQAAGQTVEGKPVDATFSLAPRAVANVRQAVDMAATGMYRDARGRKVIDTDGYEALTKAIGFQPNDVARVQQATFAQQDRIAQVRLAQGEISDAWAQGIAERDPQKIIDAQQQLRDWNAKNPDSPIRIRPQDIQRKARTLMQSKEERIQKTAPAAIRASVREQLARENLTQ